MISLIMKSMENSVLFDQKWRKFLWRTWPFRFLPFIDFVLAAGSMAMGNIRPQSDFDVIVGTRYGRIFTARFFCVLFFGLLGWRRNKWHSLNKSGIKDFTDKICFNHFVTEKSYRLSPPYNKYWKLLYKKLVPVFGSVSKINGFFSANSDWCPMLNAKGHTYVDDLRHGHKTSNFLKITIERVLSGRLGDVLERLLRRLQLAKIKIGLSDFAGYKPRLVYTDTELEFHPDTKRMERYLENHSSVD